MYGLWILLVALDGSHNRLVVCIEKLTKFTLLIPCFLGKGALIAPKGAKLFFAHVVQFFGVPREIIYNWDACFISSFWKPLLAIVGTRLRFNSALPS